MPIGSISGSVVYRTQKTQNYSSGQKASGGFAHAESGGSRILPEAKLSRTNTEPNPYRSTRPNPDALNYLVRQFVNNASDPVTREGIGLRGRQAIQAYQQNALGERKQEIHEMLGVDERV